MPAPKTPNTEAATNARRDPYGRISRPVRVLASPEDHAEIAKLTPAQLGERFVQGIMRPATAHFDDVTATRYEALLAEFAAAGLVIRGIAGPVTALGVRLELAYRQLEGQPDVEARAGEDLVQQLLFAQHDARTRRLEDAQSLPKLTDHHDMPESRRG